MRHFDATWDDRILTNENHYCWWENLGGTWALVIEPRMMVGAKYYDAETRVIYTFLGDAWIEIGMPR